jgi:hypothetical protein
VQKNIVFDESETAKARVTKSLEELSYNGEWKTLRDLFEGIKKTKTQVRFRRDDVNGDHVLFSHFDRRKLLLKEGFVGQGKIRYTQVYVMV